MKKILRDNFWLLGVASAAFAIGAQPAAAQEAQVEAPASAEEIVVPGRITYRNRSEETAPTLEYGLDYFQRFEPLTVGDALKRVPSVAFLSDVLESDGVRLRGLDPAYTQILINGEQVPGSGSSSGAFGNGADGAFFVDRIPAELIERVEIVRNQSANRSGDAVAGAINIVLRDSYALEGGYVRAGVLYFENDENWGETLGAAWGGAFAGGRIVLGANLQDRHNPKDKISFRYDQPGGTLDNIETQTDVRDGTDYSANFTYDVEALGGEIRLDGFFVHTDRDENEDSIEYRSGITNNANLLTVNDNNVAISQDSYSFNASYEIETAFGETTLKGGYALFRNEEAEFEDESEFLRDATPFPEVDRYTGELINIELEDQEIRFKIEHEIDLSDALELEFGLHLEEKERDNRTRATTDATRTRVNRPNGSTSTAARPPGVTAPTNAALRTAPGGDNTIQRERLDPYVMVEGDAGAFAWEAGLRYETTETTVQDRTALSVIDRSYEFFLPSASVKWNLTDDDRVHLSAARTVRNPSFQYLSPAVLLAELGDNDFRGNPLLEPETAWGVDVGYERRLGETGVAGVNFFYRDITDLQELYSTGVVGSEGAGTFVYSVRNTGDGQVWGVEFDLSTSLGVIGFENTGVFLNYSWLDSEVDDEFGSRRFNSQAESILNVGFIQDLPSFDAAFGVTYRKQGESVSRVVGEEVTTTYTGDLEAFVERRFGERFTLRFTGSNLLDAEKEELFNKFTTVQDQRDRSFDEFEIERETAGMVFQLIGRYAF